MTKRRMSTFTLDAELASIRAPGRFVAVPKMLVDSGSECTWIPEELLREAGIRPVKKEDFQMANGQTVTRSIGYAIIRAGAFETVDEVVFGQPSDRSLLGARTLVGFGVRVDARLERLVPSGPYPAASVLSSAGAGAPARRTRRARGGRARASCAPA